jgi:hypothetical protein
MVKKKKISLFTQAVKGLKEYYPVLGSNRIIKSIQDQVEIPDTGNDQKDYEVVRDRIEKCLNKFGGI